MVTTTTADFDFDPDFDFDKPNHSKALWLEISAPQNVPGAIKPLH
jgi:hypothetical protein